PLFELPGKPAFWLLTVLSAADSNEVGAEAALRDALQDARRKIKRLERTDSATGVPNEEAFNEILHRDWAIARREQRRLGVVLFCVDFLEEYRHSLGRHATDSVLRKVAHAINGSLRREGDFGARVGDDRFAVVLGTADEAQVRDFAERVVKKVSSLAIPHPKSPVARNITISCGYASEVPEWTSVCNTLLENAERLLLQNRPDPAADASKRADLKRQSR
ncbi:MAG: GGDEF domain-containing protein, partial [Gammaproteobacteria bacterium]|nr:GGDEF domain-containing protein [Gammaproteobacteria bacterium]